VRQALDYAAQSYPELLAALQVRLACCSYQTCETAHRTGSIGVIRVKRTFALTMTVGSMIGRAVFATVMTSPRPLSHRPAAFSQSGLAGSRSQCEQNLPLANIVSGVCARVKAYQSCVTIQGVITIRITGVVQNPPILGYTDARKLPACLGRISVGRMSVAGGGWPPRIRLAGAEAVPGPTG